MRPPEVRPGGGESGILRHAPEVEVSRHRQLDPVAGDLVAAQVELVGARGGGSLARALEPGGASEGGRQRRDDPLGELVLQAEHVAHLRLRGVRPGQGPCRSLHELGRDPQMIPRAQQGTQEDEVHVELGGDGLQVGGLGRKAGAGGARADDEGGQAAQGARHRIGQGEAQEVDLGVGAQHAEGQDHEPGEGEGGSRGLAGVPEDDAREVAGHGLRGRVAVRGRLGQGPADHAIEGHDRRGPREGRWLLVQGRLHDLHGLRPREGGTPRQGLEEDRPRREDVGARVDRDRPGSAPAPCSAECPP